MLGYRLHRLPRSSIAIAVATAVGCFAACSTDDSPVDDDATGSGGGGGAPPASGGSESASGGEATGSGGVQEEALWPELLSETGLYSDTAAKTLAEGVAEFAPAYELWTDGAEKKRWVLLPEGTQVDTSDMNNWEFPVGTKLFKEFVRDGVLVETRMLHRYREGGRGWTGVAYIWNDDESDAVAAADGLDNARGTEHDVPSSGFCSTCHAERPDWPLGFSALQLSHDDSPTNLESLWADGWLTDEPGQYAPAGGGFMRETLGYLHANCGGCHREGAAGDTRSGLRLWLNVESQGMVVQTDAYKTAINQLSFAGTSEEDYRVYGGDIELSELYRRMAIRGEGQMPELGTELVDEAGLALVKQWIEHFPPPAVGGAGGGTQ